MIRNLNIVDQLCIFHNLGQFMLLELITNYKVASSYVISYNNQIKKKIVIASKIYCKIFLVGNLHTIYSCWLFVTCIDNFESFFFFFKLTIFVLGFTISMY
jgi:hypothetical protein